MAFRIMQLFLTYVYAYICKYVIQTRHVRSPFKSSSYPDWSRMHISDVLLSNAERLTRGLHLLLLRTKLHFCLHLVRWPYIVPKSTLLLKNKQWVFKILKVCTVSFKPDAHAIFKIENSARFLKLRKNVAFFTIPTLSYGLSMISQEKSPWNFGFCVEISPRKTVQISIYSFLGSFSAQMPPKKP